MRQTALNRHRFERIGKLSSAITAHLVALALQCEYTAEVRVVTPKEEIENSYNGCHTASRKRLDFFANQNRGQTELLASHCLSESSKQLRPPLTARGGFSCDIAGHHPLQLF